MSTILKCCLLIFYRLYTVVQPLLSLKYRFKPQIITYNVRPGYLSPFVLQTSSTNRLSHRFNVSAFIQCSGVVKSSTWHICKFTELEGTFLTVLSSRQLCHCSKTLTAHFVLYPVFFGIVLATKRRSSSAVKGVLYRLTPSITVAKCDLFALSLQKNSAYSSSNLFEALYQTKGNN